VFAVPATPLPPDTAAAAAHEQQLVDTALLSQLTMSQQVGSRKRMSRLGVAAAAAGGTPVSTQSGTQGGTVGGTQGRAAGSTSVKRMRRRTSAALVAAAAAVAAASQDGNDQQQQLFDSLPDSSAAAAWLQQPGQQSQGLGAAAAAAAAGAFGEGSEEGHSEDGGSSDEVHSEQGREDESEEGDLLVQLAELAEQEGENDRYFRYRLLGMDVLPVENDEQLAWDVSIGALCLL
jgi:hypothetical protein